MNEIHLVRGDAATALDSGQPADTLHWYVEKWMDVTDALGVRPTSPTTESHSWARLRATYRSDTNPTLPRHLSPQGAILRLVGAYEQKEIGEYASVFTGDFTFEFSNSTDPDLVAKYSTGWFRADENDESASHLFFGYTPPGGLVMPPASTIDINLQTTLPVDDNTSPDPVTHKVLFTQVNGSLVFPGTPEPTTISLSNNQHAFYFVRGDVAVGLDASQPADDEHWYVYRWADLTTAFAPAASIPGTIPFTWGKVKGLYR